nr:hypothetical protein [Tanacetum cinerariifolium]
MTAYPKISRRVHDMYQNLEHDEMVKSIFNSGKNKVGVGMKISSWMITDVMKLTENHWMYAKAFGVDVSTAQLQPKIRDDLEVQKNVEKVKEHLVAEEIEEMVKRSKSKDAYEVDNSIHNYQTDPNTRLDPKSYKESPEVEKTAVVQPINIIEEDDESAVKDYKLSRRVMEESLPNMVDDRIKELTKIQVPIYVAQGVTMERKQNQADVVKMIADAIHQERENL